LGVLLPQSEMNEKIGGSRHQPTIPLNCSVQLASNDYIKVEAENDKVNSSIKIMRLQLTIK
jgi:hypothetical protein